MTRDDALAVLQPTESSDSCSTEVRHQAACVRTLLDQMDRHTGSSGAGEGLHEQLQDEVLRLAGMLSPAG